MRLNNTPPANPVEIGAGQDTPLTSGAAPLQSHAVGGWCGDGYLLPGGESVGDVGNTDFILSSTKEREAYRAAGTQDEWLDRIAIYAHNNSRLYLMLGAAFGAPLLSWAGLNGAIIHLYGGNHDVQNAVQRVGQSVWGHGYKAFVSGNASRSALEQALSRNDGLLSISGEIHASNARNLIPLTTGKVRGRGTRAGVRCGGNALRLFVTSMGDIRWEDFLGAGSGAGQNIPVISVPHWLKRPAVFADDTAFVDWAQESCNRYYGTVGRIYIQQLLANKTHWQQFAVRDFATCYNFLPDIPPGKEQIARIFAVMMTGLKLAIRFELFWGDEFDAMCRIMDCFYDVLKKDGRNETGECHE